MRRRPTLVIAFCQQAGLFPLELYYAILNGFEESSRYNLHFASDVDRVSNVPGKPKSKPGPAARKSKLNLVDS